MCEIVTYKQMLPRHVFFFNFKIAKNGFFFWDTRVTVSIVMKVKILNEENI